MNRSTSRRQAKPARPVARGRESAAARKARAVAIAGRLAAAYPAARCGLDFESPFQLLVATILSAQCTDKRVNSVTGDLFRRWPAPADMAAARPADLERVIRSTGFFRAKAKSILGCCRGLVERHGGAVPRTLEELVRLPGVGRKTANVVLGSAFGMATGVVVDTHVGRIARRLGLTRQTDAVKAERDLMAVLPHADWIAFSHRVIEHGRAMPTLGNSILWRSLYRTPEGLMRADAIRLPLWSAPGVREGSGAEQTANLAEHAEPKSGEAARIARFAAFSDGFVLARGSPDQAATVLYDARYSMDTAGFEPMWGVRVSTFRPIGGDRLAWHSGVSARRERMSGLLAEILGTGGGGGDGAGGAERSAPVGDEKAP